MNVALFISRKLRLTPGEGRRTSTNVVIAVAGIACAVAVMLQSVGIVLGFKNAIRQKVSGFESAISIEPARNVSGDAMLPVSLTPTIRAAIAEAAPEARAYPAIRHAGILKTDTDFSGVMARSLPYDGDELRFVSEMLVGGELPSDSARQILISEPQAKRLKLEVGDKIYSYFFVNGALKARRYTISGLFRSNFGDYDNLAVYLPLSELQGICGLGDGEGLRLELSGIEEDEISPVSERLQQELNRAYAFGELPEPMVVDTRLRSGVMYYNWLGLLDTNVVVILILMGCVSGFTLISSVFILILERVRMIGQLKSLGADNRLIRRIFVLLGGRIVLIGLLIGNLLALGLLLTQQAWHYIPLDPEAYYLSYVPVEINWLQVALVDAGVVALSALLMLIPASTVARISPAKTMRFE